MIRYRSPLAGLPSGDSMSAALPFLRSRRLPCLTYCHQPPQHFPRRSPHVATGSCRLTRQGFAIHSQARQSVEAESCSSILYFLRSARFSTLLPTPPRGDAVTSSSQPGCVRSWLECPTPEGVGASQRTSGDLRSAAANGESMMPDESALPWATHWHGRFGDRPSLRLPTTFSYTLQASSPARGDRSGTRSRACLSVSTSPRRALCSMEFRVSQPAICERGRWPRGDRSGHALARQVPPPRGRGKFLHLAGQTVGNLSGQSGHAWGSWRMSFR